AASVAGLDADAATRVRRAGLVHDLGIVGVPAGVWNRRGPLTRDGHERVRLHTHLGERILARCPGLDDLASDVGAHHERIDGSGYHRGGRVMPAVAQIVAAAEVYRGCREDRPHRAALDAKAAARVLG